MHYEINFQIYETGKILERYYELWIIHEIKYILDIDLGTFRYGRDLEIFLDIPQEIESIYNIKITPYVKYEYTVI